MSLVERQKQIDILKRKKTNTLEEEKERQMQLLKLNLKSIDPDLENVVACQSETQELIVQQKREELQETQARLNEMNQSLSAS